MITAIGLGTADFFFCVLCMLLYAWALVMAVSVIAFAVLSVYLLGKMRQLPFFSLPPIPYHCAVFLGIAFLALAILTAIGAVYFFAFIRQLIRSFGRFHKNTLAAASGNAPLPSLPVYPQFAGRTKRRLRNAVMISVIAFSACFVAGFLTCVITAGSFEFWHTWGWFGYVG